MSTYLTSTTLPFLALAVTLSLSGCGFFRDDDGGGDGRGKDRHGRAHEPGDEPCEEGEGPKGGGGVEVPDAGPLPTLDGSSADASTPAPVDAGAPLDAGTATTAPSSCVEGDDCAAGERCEAGACAPCEGSACACARDDDCGGGQVCDHLNAQCGPRPVRCAELTDEAACLADARCEPVYAGVHCRDALGGECGSEDPDCTCERFTFAACATR